MSDKISTMVSTPPAVNTVSGQTDSHEKVTDANSHSNPHANPPSAPSPPALQDKLSTLSSYYGVEASALASNSRAFEVAKADYSAARLPNANNIGAILELIMSTGQSQRKADSVSRIAETEEAVSTLNHAAEKMEKAARFALAAGIVSGTLSIASGAFSVAGGIKYGGGATSMWDSKAQSGLMGVQGISTMLNSLGEAGKTVMTYEQNELQADEKKLEAVAGEQQAQAQWESDHLDTANKSITNSISEMQSVEQSRHESAQAIVTA